ncbi:MAG: prepilin-type N-terminal cleavage/methylation domain-containing protein [Opitutae bacterium]|nr:prepilin-type N-terminal cleavage/methylation domain-containing protein [Opitutae bacterium]
MLPSRSSVSSGTRRVRRAFTLVEVMIASTIGAGVLAGVLSSFLFLTRTGVRAAQYNDMQAQVRLGLEKFSEDARMASAITWNGNLSVTLTVPNNYPPNNLVTYAFDPDTPSASSTGKCFYYKTGDVSSTETRTVLVRNINDFLFYRYDRLDNQALSNTSTKRLQVTFTARSTGVTLADSTETAISSSFILRNKPVN